MNQELQRIIGAVNTSPNLAYDPSYISMYQKAGGTLSNGAIPVTKAPTGVDYKSPAVITTQGVQKDILDPIKEAISPKVDTSTQQTSNTPQPKITPEDELFKKEIEKQKTPIEKEYEADVTALNEILNPLKSQLDRNKQQQIDSIKSKYSLLRTQTEQANERRNKLQETIGVRFGGRFAIEHTADLFKEKVREGIQNIQELNNQEQEAINTITNAFDDKSFSLAVKEFDKLQEIRKKRDDKLAQIEKAQIEGLKKIQENQRISSIATSVADIMKQGVNSPIDIIDFINNYEDGTPTGANLTAKELKEMMEVFQPGKTTDDLGTDGKMYQFAVKQGWLPEGATIFDYWKMEKEAKSSPKAYKIGSGIGGKLDSGFTQFSKESVALSMVPVALRNSDTEKEYLLSGIRAGLSEGRTPYEIADTLMGYMINDKTAFSEGMRKYISMASGEDKNMAPEIARLINSGQYELAITKIDGELYNKAKAINESFISEPEVAYLNTKANEIQQLLNSYGFFDVVGNFSGTFEDALGKLGRKKGQELKTKITSLTQDMQKRQAGSSMTEEEFKRLIDPVVPKLSDKRSVFENKLKEAKSNPLQKLNAERVAVGLPEINEKQLFNKKLRIPLYSSETAVNETDAEQMLINLGNSNIQLRPKITQMLNDGLSYQEILELVNE